MILVTDATGTVGSAVCSALADDPLEVRAGVRSPDHFDGPADEVVTFDFANPSTYRETFEGVDSMFLVRPPALSRVRRDIVPALAAAVGAGVDHVVFLSVIGADRNRFVPHARIEWWLESAPLSTTFLRASFFSEPLDDPPRRDSIRRADRPGRNWSDEFYRCTRRRCDGSRDSPHSATGEYDLTGPEALGYRDVCRQLSATLDHGVTYAVPSLSRFLFHRLRTDCGLSKSLVMAGIYTTGRLGLADRMTGDVSRLLGREPTTLRILRTTATVGSEHVHGFTVLTLWGQHTDNNRRGVIVPTGAA